MPDLRAEREPVPEETGGGATKWLIAAVIVLLLAGGGYFAYTNYIQPHEELTASTEPTSVPAPALSTPPAAAPTPVAPKKSVRADGGRVSRDQPDARGDAGQGQGIRRCWRDERARSLSGAVPPRRAAPPAQVELASFYDPLVTPPKAGFTPDGARAADWYERAALAGNAEAQRKYGLLLAKGGAGLPADQGRAKSWLQQAAAQNDAEAKKALETMPK